MTEEVLGRGGGERPLSAETVATKRVEDTGRDLRGPSQVTHRERREKEEVFTLEYLESLLLCLSARSPRVHRVVKFTLLIENLRHRVTCVMVLTLTFFFTKGLRRVSK